ncbi:protein FAR1-RELATED SEQUENCE 5-like [Arachis ipaensis]|uniref:protein FAR1-RELATED SEQUENCE 5-like n=1 Tax=Arachis ipaensis TaxID=130454 RepID=UPI000A2B0CE0|nr:protein FAR1-RELATED SEQUENCE 5-like [Arachis ipaensis]XP_025670321.1 protein FAR1-RELATED SEQUENCE 5-like [Arachis hypogaea]
MVEPLGYDMSVVAEILSNHPQNISGDVIVNGEKSNKAMQLSNVTEVRSEEIELGDELPDHGCLQEHEILRVGMRFVQLWMTHDFYVTYAKKVGFATKIRMTTYDNITKAPLNQAIHCNRDGYHGSCVKAPMRKNTISAAGCKARIYVKFDKDMQDWVLFKVDLMHSHPCSARKVVHYHEYRQLTIHAKCVIEDNDEAGIQPNKTFLALANEAGGPSNLGFSEKDLRNYITLDEECKFKSAVWVDARCRASYEYYGDVVSVDSTYSTNRHGLPFVSFIGINHHGNSTLLSCALLGNEKIPSYEWRIITDQRRSILRAIKNTLPDTRHRWCIWHITKKLLSKLGGYRRYRDLYDDLNDIMWNSRTEESFEDYLSEFMDEYKLHNNTWLSSLLVFD